MRQFLTRLVAGTLLGVTGVSAQAYSAMSEAQAQSCAGIDNQLNGGVDEVSASATAESAGMCQDGRSSSAFAVAGADIATARISIAGSGSGDEDINGASAQASFGDRLTIEGVPDGIDTVDLRIRFDFVASAPAPAFFNSASFTAIVNAQVVSGDVRLEGCSGDLCIVPDPVADAALDQTITLNRNGLGEFGFIDVFLDARLALASTSSTIDGEVDILLMNLPEATIVSESGVFNTIIVDGDGDSVPDQTDNCLILPNQDQRDTDADGLGNLCDADLNNDCIVNVTDLGLLRSVFFSADPDADFNGDGTVNAIDLGILRLAFFQPPGPGASPNLCAP